MDYPYPACIARVRIGEHDLAGTAFLAAPGLVATCAHVVNAAAGQEATYPYPPGHHLTLDFPFLGDGRPRRAVVREWLPLIDRVDDHLGDIAVLSLLDPPPDGALPPVPVAAPLLRGRRVYAYGFAETWGSSSPDLEVLGPRPSGRLELAVTSSFGRGVRHGYSGAPVFDMAGGLVGMLAAVSGNPDDHRSYIIPVHEVTALLGVAAPPRPESPRRETSLEDSPLRPHAETRGETRPEDSPRGRSFTRSAAPDQLPSVLAAGAQGDVLIANRSGLRRVNLYRPAPLWEAPIRWDRAAATPSMAMAVVTSGLTLTVIDGESGAALATGRAGTPPSSVALSADGRTAAIGAAVALGGGRADVELRDCRDLSELRRLRGHNSTITSIAFSRDSRLLAAAAGRDPVRVWDVESGRPAESIPVPAAVGALAMSRNQSVLALGTDRIVHLWNRGSGAMAGALEGHRGAVTALAFSADGRILYSGCSQGTVRAWSALSWKLLEQMPSRGGETPRSVTALVAPADPDAGDHVVIATGDGQVTVWAPGGR